MSCVLRIYGEFLDIDTLIFRCSIPAHRIWVKGEQRLSKGKTHATSGANFIASDADFTEFDIQIIDATSFLEEHALAIKEIAAFPGVQHMVLDFAVTIKNGYAMQSSYLPPKFVQLAAQLGIGLEVSHYPCSD